MRSYIKIATLVLLFIIITLSFIGCKEIEPIRDLIAGNNPGVQIAIKDDGAVNVMGEMADMYDFSDWENISSISVGWGNIGGVKDDGTALVVSLDETKDFDVSKWTDIVTMGFTIDTVFGLKSDGTVICAENVDDIYFGDEINKKVESWTDIVQLDVAECSVAGVKRNGTVVTAAPDFIGFDKVDHWKDVKQVSICNDRIVGLTHSGDILVALGAFAKIVDQGYFEPYEDIRDADKVCAGHNFVAGLMPDGTATVRMTIMDNMYLNAYFDFEFDDETGSEELIEWMKLLHEAQTAANDERTELHEYTIRNMPEDFKAINNAENVVDINSYEDCLVALLEDGTILVAGENDD